jgi:hypothetical protein
VEFNLVEAPTLVEMPSTESGKEVSPQPDAPEQPIDSPEQP